MRKYEKKELKKIRILNPSRLGPVQICSDGWELLGYHCVAIFTKPLHWDTAKLDCRQNGGYLGSIHSANYNAFMMSKFNSLNIEPTKMWIGMQYQGNQGLPRHLFYDSNIELIINLNIF